ncbi:MAG: peptide chain release factor 3 [Phenylobacterium sp.]|uniref:peptide chain release factor 3 n=1 Tax=Phenylobacterium sp. TaxID=1871053 RepID=UPI001B591AE7|nr:peptide chain release factor 3 [Phenylobacterium sp.]MBP7651529.1 peptide chain release factor 3 [Phenylobacterium sp.]MBP7816150.1 peptide chain release factor 3 [Phenylobacterium sp.]MBP9230020.1 peptide chain release factor 3 [Phenylobacterium sp.]MBP9753451.1 peptide chain release factor 3 [Phenylobacterium sp.]
MSNSPAAEAARRRTFAIISHPDAGKTTLTENLLLAGGAIRAAGAVRARGENRRTRSDWMKIERERGISVSASVMTFDHDGLMFNLLDTPGHEDFSEDTYRTLTAADAAVMVLDAAKGIEPQTLKLFEVCRLRDIPIVTFINKMDREAQDPIELLDEIASKLALDPAPLYWPAGSGGRFKGMLDLRKQQFLPFAKKTADNKDEGHPAAIGFAGNAVSSYLDPDERAELEETAMLVGEASKPFDPQAFLEGHMTPVFFGSALRHFGIDQLLAGLGAYAPPPKAVAASKGGDATHIVPGDPEVTGFVFKVQANMDPNHRDRIAFLRLCSGKFARGMKLKVQNTGRQLSVNAPIMFFASDRELAEEAFAGDVIGIPNHGVLRVGDSLSETGTIRFAGLPNFAPEILQRVRVKDPLKAKHLKKALEGLAEEGVTQLFRPQFGADFIVGAVGQLQFEVMADRLANEYQLEVQFEASPFAEARWVTGTKAEIEDFTTKHKTAMATDIDEQPVFLAKSAWELGYVTERYPAVAFHRTRERG